MTPQLFKFVNKKQAFMEDLPLRRKGNQFLVILRRQSRWPMNW